ncbi:MAG TPA: hypothetical protein VHM22_18975, partial [Bradyrhizobium sp.]|nr:hypothetical protein [Bradyrhizobium sp.]
IPFIVGQVFADLFGQRIGGDVVRNPGANADREINACGFNAPAYQHVMQACPLPRRNVQSAPSFIALGSCAVPSILKAAVFEALAVTAILNPPFSVAIVVTIGSIPSFLPEAFISTATSLVSEAFTPFRALLRARSFSTTPLIVETILPISASF